VPIGVDFGDVVKITAQFTDPFGGHQIPQGLAVLLNISYFPIGGGSSTTAVMPMLPVGYTWFATWNSAAAAYGRAMVSFTVGSTTLLPPDPILLINRNT
jgi:hypothetical protein